MPLVLSSFAGLLLLLLALSPVAETVSLSDARALTLDEAIQKTLEQSPRLKAAAGSIDAARALESQAGLGENPTFSATVEDALGTGEAAGVDAMQTTLSLNFVLDSKLVDQRLLRAEASTAYASSSVALETVDAAAETARRFINVLGISASLKQRREALAIARETLEVVSQGVSVGRLHGADLHRAEADKSRAELAVDDGEHELRVARHALAARWGWRQPDFVRLAGSIEQLPEPRTFDSIIEDFEQSPLRRKFLTEERLAHTSLELERARARRPIEYQVGVRHLRSTSDLALVAGISVPLTWRNRNEGNIRAKEVEIETLAAQQAAVEIDLHASLFELYEGLEHSLHESNVLREAVIPQLEKALQQTREAYRLGRYGFQELQSVQRELLSMRQRLISTNIEAQLRSIEIERLTGTAVQRSDHK